MRITRSVPLWISALFVMCFGLALAQDGPPVPSKSLPQPGLTARTLTSPSTRAAYAIRSEPVDSDSDTDDQPEITAEEAIEVDKALGMTTEPDAANRGIAPAEAAPAAAAPAAAATSSESFAGTARKAAKLSIATAPIEPFTDVKTLIDTLPSKTAMVNHTPKITTLASSNRVVEEKRNVQVRCWLYAASKEADNDFHLILGREPGQTPQQFMTMELSGLPPANASSFAKLKGARESFKSFFGSDLPGTSYDFYNPPIPVMVEGSLFFDMSHATGNPPGPNSLRPNMPVIWEVHPITKIVFEPSP